MSFIQEATELNRRGVYFLHAGETANAYESFHQAHTMIVSHICTDSALGSSLPLHLLPDSLMENCDGMSHPHRDMEDDDEEDMNNSMQVVDKATFENTAAPAWDSPHHPTECCSTPPAVGNRDTTRNGGRSPTTTPATTATSSRILTVGIPGLKDKKLYIYARAMIFYPEATIRQTTNDCLLYSATILFNLAICSHSIGKSSGNPFMLNHAAEMYEMCLKSLPLVVEEESPSSPCGGATNNKNDNTLLGIVALNNSAQLYHEMSPKMKMNRKLQYALTVNSLSSVMALFGLSSFPPPYGQQQQQLEQMNEKFQLSVTEILTNVVFLSNPSYCYCYCAPSA